LALWTDVPDARRYAQITEQPGTLILAMRVDTSGLFTPTVQPGSELDYQRSDDQWIVGRRLRLRSSQAMEVMWEGTTFWSSEADGEHRVELDCGDVEQKLPRLQVTLSTAKTPITFHVEWVAVFADGMSRVGPLSLARLLVPWASRQAATVPESGARTIPELAEANWGRGFKIFRHKDVACIQCHVAHGEGGDIGPDLSNLVHRDYTSVMRDVRHPGFAINPDYITYVVQTKAGRVLSGVVRSDGENLRVGDAEGRVTTLRHDEIEAIEPSPKSVMPEGLVDKLDAGQLNDLLAYLLLPAPRMSRAPDQPAAVAHYTRDEIAKRIIPLSTDAPPSNPLHLLLVAGAKDHGPNEHDYPAWLRTWSQLLSAADNITVDTAMEWPTAAQMERADTIVIYQRGDWSMDRAAMIDRHLTRGGGLVLIHWAIEGGDAAGEFARRIGFASNQTLTKYRHGPLEIHWAVAGEHPIARNLGTMQLHDESYWGLVGDATQVSVLARGAAEEGAIRPPLFWTVEPQAGRVFVSIPGHYSWTFDDPLFRLVLLRGIAWASREPVDRLAPLVYLGAKPPTPH
jgi:putative heme-binding domain-containing protein